MASSKNGSPCVEKLQFLPIGAEIPGSHCAVVDENAGFVKDLK